MFYGQSYLGVQSFLHGARRWKSDVNHVMIRHQKYLILDKLARINDTVEEALGEVFMRQSSKVRHFRASKAFSRFTNFISSFV